MSSTQPISATPDSLNSRLARTRGESAGAWAQIQSLLAPLASLRLTVVLFALSILLTLVGTLAQVEKNMWEVMHEYFRCWFAWLDFQVFFPISFFNPAPRVPGGIWIPGGYALGLALALNLAAAHISRFKVQAKGQQLWIGWGITLLGAFLTTVIILGGQSKEGLQGLPLVSPDQLWLIIRWGLSLLWIGSVILLIRMDRKKVTEFGLVAGGSLILGLLSLYLIAKGDTARLGDSSLRILWQLLQGGLAGVILLVGCVMVFKRRGGIVLIHAGIALLMFGELLVGLSAVEEQITLAEGTTARFARDIRKVELAIVDRSPGDHDEVTIIPQQMLTRGRPIEDQQLPFDIEVVEYLKNANLRPLASQDVNLASTGIGLKMIADPARSAGGAEASQAVDIAAAYLKITPKDGAAEPATYLLAQHFGDADVLLQSSPAPIPEKITVGNKSYELYLRYQRNYKPYELTLKDIRKDDYLGTSTPRDYSSWISLDDPSRGFSRDRIRIWMNNPLRYAGETFYQSGYVMRPDGTEVSTLQVVTNTGWMIPYVACMLVAVGLLYHFSLTLLRFLQRRIADSVRQSVRVAKGTGSAQPRLGKLAWIVPLAFAGVFLFYVLSAASTKVATYQQMDLTEFGKIPVVYGGRVKPIDTLARNALRTVSNKQVLYAAQDGDFNQLEKAPAIRWLLDVISQSEEAQQHRIFRIENLDVLATLGLERRKGFLYSVDEVRGGIEEFEKQAAEARQLSAADASQLSFYQRKLLETDNRLRTYSKLQSSFLPIPFPALPSEAERQADPDKAKETMEEIARLAVAVPQLNQRLMGMQPPLVVPVSSGDTATWLPFAAAANDAFVKKIFSGQSADRRLIAWSTMIDAYARQDATDFNRSVASYLKDVGQYPPEEYRPSRVAFESFFNSFQPFTVSMVLYICAFVVTACSWLGWFVPLRRSALVLILLAFAVHSFALVARISISGRPPITNLYSSAVFVGWGCALMGIALEFMFRLGAGNILSAVMGFSTLIIAHNLAYGGDTFTVLQAVLDTQFWLATHVVCISLGYVATFAAGVLAIIYVLGGVLTAALRGDIGKSLARMVYGVVCFAIFFSFVGTVLGGLWADDSWGRFWGWDPKENGALIIVLWNALVLHARWGGMIKDRGVCVLAIVGNIVTAWSWFGVNELGIGLHSYGFTDGVLPALGMFVASQLAIVVLGCLPLGFWRSRVVADSP